MTQGIPPLNNTNTTPTPVPQNQVAAPTSQQVASSPTQDNTTNADQAGDNSQQTPQPLPVTPPTGQNQPVPAGAPQLPPPPPPPAPYNGGWDDPWGMDEYNDYDDFGAPPPMGNPWGPPMGGRGPGRPPKPQMTPEEREKMIKEAYEEVMGRKAEQKDINYYKYGTQTKEQIKMQLVGKDEHKKLVKEGHKFQKLNRQYEELESKKQMLEAKIQDSDREKKLLSDLLAQKNQEITNLRASNQTLTQQTVQGAASSRMYGGSPDFRQPATTSAGSTTTPYEKPGDRYQSSNITRGAYGVRQPATPTAQPDNRPSSQPSESAPPRDEQRQSSDSLTPLSAESTPQQGGSTPNQARKPDIIDRITSFFF